MLFFRKSKSKEINKYAFCVFLRMGVIDADKIEIKKYSKENFKAALKEVRSLVPLETKDFLPKIQSICADAGVYVVFTPSIKDVPVVGLTKIHEKQPLIQISDRGKKSDVFWFTFFHEAAHVLLHLKKGKEFCDDGEDFGAGPLEKEANDFAEQWLITPDQLEEVKNYWYSPKESVKKTDRLKQYAREFKIDVGIVVGVLQRQDKLERSQNPHKNGKPLYEYPQLNSLKQKFDIRKSFPNRGPYI